LGDALPAVIGLIVFGVLAVAQARSGIGFFVRGASDSTASLPLINPDLAPGWQIGFFALLALSLVIEIVRYVRGFWTRSMLLLALVEGILWIVYVIALALTAPIVNPELGRRISEESDWWDQRGAANILIAIVIIWGVLQALWEGWNGYQRYRQSRIS
jgi:hypothetical protein